MGAGHFALVLSLPDVSPFLPLGRRSTGNFLRLSSVFIYRTVSHHKLTAKENRKMKKQWLIILVGLTMALATAGTMTAFALTDGGGSTPPAIEDPPLPKYED
jgi:hypothetical protein